MSSKYYEIFDSENIFSILNIFFFDAHQYIDLIQS